MAVFSLKIAPKHDTKNLYPPVPVVTAEMCGIDPKEYQGFAFGVGLERIALLKYEIDDMRLLYENDDRFLNQF